MSKGRTKQPPNFIFILCDDLGYGDLGCYGSTLNRTPVLDRMAAEGALFSDYYAAPLCSPSRAALMTGCYPQRVGLGAGERFAVLLPRDSLGINPKEKLIPALLKTRGYATKLIGKWHLGDQPEFLPTRNGFDSFFGLPYSNDMDTHIPSHDIFRFPDLPVMRDEKIVELNPDQSRLTHRYVEEAVSFIEENRDRPFFLYFAHMYVHLPLYPPAEFKERSQNGDYGAEVECIDWSTGVLLDALKRLGIAERTLVIFSSDNGALTRLGVNTPLRGGKGTTWEGGVREPCIAWWPGTIPAGRRSSEIVTTMDVLPTYCHLAGAEVPRDRTIDGKNIWPLMAGDEGAVSPHEAYYYYRGHSLEGVRSGPFKLHFTKLLGKEHTEALYDLGKDVGEEHDAAAEHPEVVTRLRELAEKTREDLGDGVYKGRNCRPAGWVAESRSILEYAAREK